MLYANRTLQDCVDKTTVLRELRSPVDQLIGKRIEADDCQVQAGKGNLYRHGSFTVKSDLICVPH